MQVLSAHRPRIPIPVIYPSLCLPYSSPQKVLPLTSPHSIIHSEEPFALHHLPSPANEMMTICGCMTAGKNRKNYWVWSSPNTDIRTKSEDRVTLCLSSLLPESRAEMSEKS